MRAHTYQADDRVTISAACLQRLLEQAAQAPESEARWGALLEAGRALRQARCREVRRWTRHFRRQLARLRDHCADRATFLALAAEAYPQMGEAQLLLELELFDRFGGYRNSPG